jgi:hypothetical protein
MPYSSRWLSDTIANSRLVAACIGVSLFATQCSAAEILIDDEIEFQTAYCCVVLDSKARTDCGWLVVPEDWENPGAQKLKLPVVIYRALNPDPAKAPVIYLSGAPD